jgi:hypothetical protein
MVLARRENPETKRRFHNLLVVSKLFDKLQHRSRREQCALMFRGQ